MSQGQIVCFGVKMQHFHWLLTSLGHCEGQWVDPQIGDVGQNRTVQLGVARVTALSSKTDVEPSWK